LATTQCPFVLGRADGGGGLDRSLDLVRREIVLVEEPQVLDLLLVRLERVDRDPPDLRIPLQVAFSEVLDPRSGLLVGSVDEIRFRLGERRHAMAPS
jgi:hypothetical protein